MSSLALPAIASFNTTLYLGGPTSPASYVAQGRVGNIKFGGVAIDLVDVSNQTATAHRQLATLLKTGDMTFDLYWEPATDATLFALVLAAPPVLQQWKITWAANVDGTSWEFNGYLKKFAPDSGVGKALVAACTIAIDGSVSVVSPAAASTLTLTQVAVAAGVATYSYSGYTGAAPAPGAMQVTGFVNAGNNGPCYIFYSSGGASGTVAAIATNQTNETHAATGTINAV